MVSGPLSSTVIHLAVAVADGQSGIDDVTRRLREDPNLVGAILRESNSEASAPTGEIDTIEAATMRLGLGRVLAIAADSSIAEQTREELVGYELAGGRCGITRTAPPMRLR